MSARRTQAPPRRVPAQERSQRRYDAILDAAGALFGEQGFEGTTMEAIAARAGTSIGSVYQFFDNKTHVFRAVAERCLDASRRLFAQLTSVDFVGAAWETLIDRAVDEFFALQDTEPAYRAIWTNLQLYGEYAEADEALIREMITATAALLGIWQPELPESRRRLIAKMLVSTVSSMLLFTAREQPDQARAMVEECKRMLRGYLGNYLPPSGA